jgi:ssRNA-specific RNase YbeY (16S rRNA maturation enzyme)
LGHDHGIAEEKKHMWAAQADVLVQLGIPPSIVHA